MASLTPWRKVLRISPREVFLLPKFDGCSSFIVGDKRSSLRGSIILASPAPRRETYGEIFFYKRCIYWPCVVCHLGVRSNSIHYDKCKYQIHKSCTSIKCRLSDNTNINWEVSKICNKNKHQVGSGKYICWKWWTWGSPFFLLSRRYYVYKVCPPIFS